MESSPPRPGPWRQVLGLLLGLVAGLLVCYGGLWLLVALNEHPRSSLGKLLFGLIGLFQFAWLIPLAWLGWRRRNVGFIIGVLLASVPLILLDCICFYPAWRGEGLHH